MDWLKNCYARLLIDNHITEDHPSFMTRFDPAAYVSRVKQAGVNCAMVYACCHNGNCYYPTKVGHMHKNLAGRDVFGRTVELLRQEGITPVAYCTVIYHNHSAKHHPGWRRTDFRGVQHDGRYWYSCPNSPDYRAFAKAQIAEIVAYPVEGIFIDMTFWPGVCACGNCRERFLKETREELPSVVDWANPTWIAFQRARERWMGEFARELTAAVRGLRSDITVTHQFSPVLIGWFLGQSPAIAEASDYASGDFYGGKAQHSLGAKVFAAFSRRMPFEFMTSRCVTLNDHTSMKSEEEMLCHVATTLAHGGAYMFIDAINPDGTLSPDVYERLGRVAVKIEPFKKRVQTLQPVLTADVGLYFSMPSYINPKDNGVDLRQLSDVAGNMAVSSQCPPLNELVGTSRILSQAKIPYRIVTNDRVDLSGLTALIINDAAFMSRDEAEAIRTFVHDGGTLVATGATSLYDVDGRTTGDFQLADVFGVNHSGEKGRRVSYLHFDGEIDTPPLADASPTERTQYVACYLPAPLVRAAAAKVLARVCEPHFDPDHPDRWASIHSNPPGPPTDFAGLSIHPFGRGRCVYLYSSILAMPTHAHRQFGGQLLRTYAPSGLMVSSNAPSCVDLTVLKSSIEEIYLLCLVNHQEELPNIPVHNLVTTLRLPEGLRPRVCRRGSNGQELAFEFRQGAVTLVLPELDTVEMMEIIAR